ncbi:MAG: VOC family protein [Actinomycetota bacterium]|nr:VOC family protein [Actinomycetota bacterium]
MMETAVGRLVWHDHVSGDPERARAFYSELLGWEIEVWKPGELDYPMINANGQGHGGFGRAEGGAPPHWLGHVVVDDADAAGERARSAGGAVVGEPIDVPEVGRIVVIRDPHGAAISAFQPAGDGSMPEGVFVWDELMTSDVEAAKRFYRELFGWESREVEMGESGPYTLFRLGETDFAGCISNEATEAPPHWYPYLATPDVDAATAKAEELGATLYAGPMEIENVGRFAVLGDPIGATFALFRAPAS